jgi:hypothetical protein
MLNMQHLTLSAELLSQLPALTGLTALELGPRDGMYGSMGEGLEAVCQLTGLRALAVCFEEAAGEGLLLQLTQLKQLTRLEYRGPVNGRRSVQVFASKVSGTEQSTTRWCPTESREFREFKESRESRKSRELRQPL